MEGSQGSRAYLAGPFNNTVVHGFNNLVKINMYSKQYRNCKKNKKHTQKKWNWHRWRLNCFRVNKIEDMHVYFANNDDDNKIITINEKKKKKKNIVIIFNSFMGFFVMWWELFGYGDREAQLVKFIIAGWVPCSISKEWLWKSLNIFGR